MIDVNRHDDRFYHCDCLEEGSEHDYSKFYHCDCIETDGGYVHDEPAPVSSPAPKETT